MWSKIEGGLKMKMLIHCIEYTRMMSLFTGLNEIECILQWRGLNYQGTQVHKGVVKHKRVIFCL